uniref:Ribosomal protein L16 n=1 Tax=Gruberia lanceolata TaxID=1978530 RepID=A0A6C0UDS6_9CILI|nr:ribosomal protein L16 [Gruberia lanceolata]
MLKLKKNLKYKKYQKNRIKMKFYFFYKFKLFSFNLVLLNSSLFYYNHLKMLYSLVQKKKSKYKKLSRKSQYKQLNVENKLSRLMIKKSDLYRIGLKNIYSNIHKKYIIKKKEFYLKNYEKNFKQMLYINVPYLPYTKKTTGSRMGKGKGGVKNWYIKLPSGWVIISLLSWNYLKAFRLLKILCKKLPNNYKIVQPIVCKHLINYLNKRSNIILWNI